MDDRDVTGERQTESGAAAVAIPGGVQPGEGVEDALPIRGGDPRSIVGDHQFGAAVDAVHLNLDDLRRVPLRVVEQIRQCSGDQRGDGVHHGRPRVQPDVHRDLIVSHANLRPDELGQIQLLPRGDRAGFQLDQQKEIGDDPLQAVDVFERVIQQLGHGGLARVQPGFLQLGAEPGDRSSQLVRRIGGEPPLLIARLFQMAANAVQNVVHPAQLILAVMQVGRVFHVRAPSVP